MQGYQQAHRVHEPKRIRGCEDARLQTITHELWEYEDAGMQARAHESEDMMM